MHPPTLIAASYLMLIREDEILMSRRFQTGYKDGKYSLPAGHVEVGETFTQTIIRETQEEIGVRIEEKDLAVTHVLHRRTGLNERETERIEVFFICRSWEGEPEIMEPEKCDHIQWFSYSDLPIETIPYIRHVIECWQKEIFYSEFGWK